MSTGSVTELTHPDRAGTAGPVRESHRPRGRRLLAVAAVAALVGVLAARATTHDPVPTPPATAAATNPTDLVATLQQKVANQPEDLKAWQQLGVAYTRNAIRTGDPSLYDAARAAFDRADALDPGAAETLVGRGLLDLTLHRFADALALGERAHAANPSDPDALAITVDASVETGDYDHAATRLQALLDLRPGLAAFSRESYLRELHGDVDGAEQSLIRAETAGSGSSFDQASVVSLEGDLAFNHGDTVRASQLYDRANALSTDVVLARVGHARVLAAGGDLDGAIAALVTITDVYPLPSAVTLLGDLQTIAGQPVEAARSYDLVRTTAKLQAASGAVTDLEMAVFEADHGGTNAVALATDAFAARPTIYGADAMAWALRQSGRSAEAIPFIEQALRLDTQDAMLHYHAASVYADTGDTQRASSELATAFRINPWFSFLHRADATALAHQLGVTTPAAWG